MIFSPIGWLSSYLFLVIGGLLTLLAIGHILYQRRSSTAMISWILFILFMPHVAVPLYFLIGIRKRALKQVRASLTFPSLPEDHQNKDEHVLATILQRNGIPPATAANRFEIITDGVDAYHQMILAMDAAQESILIATYVFGRDATTQAILQALTRKAQAGVAVYLLIDIVGSFGAYLHPDMLRPLKKAGGHVTFFLPLFHRPLRKHFNLRNHRKIYLVDQKVLFSGGMNLSDDYLGEANGSPRWKDLLYRLEGPAVATFVALFKNDWLYAAGSPVTLPEYAPSSEGKHHLQVVPSGPDIPRDALYEALIESLCAARERIWIVTPYFVPDETLLQALILACHKGVDVTLVTPRHSNHLLADLTRSSYMRQLEEAGGTLRLYEGEMLHAKAILIDHLGGMVGSLNLDNRSLFLNYEVVTFVYSPKVIADLEQWMQELMRKTGSGLLTPSKIREAGENIMRVIAPLV